MVGWRVVDAFFGVSDENESKGAPNETESRAKQLKTGVRSARSHYFHGLSGAPLSRFAFILDSIF